MSDGQSVCIVNIGPRERRKRLLTGIAVLALSAGAAAAFLVTGLRPSWLRLLLFFPFLFGILAVAQARAGL